MSNNIDFQIFIIFCISVCTTFFFGVTISLIILLIFFILTKVYISYIFTIPSTEISSSIPSSDFEDTNRKLYPEYEKTPSDSSISHDPWAFPSLIMLIWFCGSVVTGIWIVLFTVFSSFSEMYLRIF